MTNADQTFYILDSYGLIYRAYYAFISRPLVNTDGDNISAVFGFFRNFFRILKDYNPQFAVAAFDSRTPTFRHKMFDEYKATRQKTPEDLHAQIPLIEEILTALGIPIIRCDGYEADDIIATMAAECRRENRPCRILTGDKDLMQLVDDYTFILKPDKTGGWALIDAEGVQNEWGVTPQQMQSMLALTGDTADNIPGVKGIGEKTAQKLLAQYGSLDGVYAHIAEITGSTQKKLTEGKESAYFSHKLVELCNTVPVSTDIQNFSTSALDFQAAARLLAHYGLPSVAKTYAADVTTTELNTASPEKAAESAQKTSDKNAVSTGSFADPVFPSLTENKGDYTAITDKTVLANIIEEILQKGCVAFDCETDSLNPHNAHMAGFSLSTEKGKAVYIPFISEETSTLEGTNYIAQKDAFVQLERIFSNENMLVITHNGKFDYEVLRANGLLQPKCRFADTMIASWLLNPERASFSLESLAETQLGLKTISFESLVPKPAAAKGMNFTDVPLEKAVPYASEDADLTWQLWQLFEPQLKKAELFKLFTEIEMPVLPILAEMEIAGIHIDKNALNEYGVELTKDIALSQQQVYELAGHEFNIASTKQLQEVLFTERKLPTSKKTKTGFSTDTAVLEELARIDPIPQKILEYRTLSKLFSTYVDALPQLAGKDGRVRTSFIQTGTATGRLSSRDPNLQNIPVREEAGRRIRSAFTAEDGHVLVSADYSQIELVILAHLSGDANLQSAFNNGVDVHKATASLIFGIPAEQVTSDMRRTAKTINFGVMYGMSAFRLSNELNIPRTTAKEFIDTYFATYSGIQQFIQNTVAKAEQTGFVETIYGRRRYIRNINTRNKLEKAAAERIAVNTPIQGSAADIVKCAMIAVDKALKGSNLNSKLLLQVHDELILECPQEEAERVCALVKHEMEHIITLSVPLNVSVESGKNWGLFH